MTNYRLRLPGPTAVPERVRAAMAQAIVSHRGPEFRARAARCGELLQAIAGTRNRILFFAASGTGMMEAALVNVLGPGERVLVVVHGQFGERFAAIGAALGATVDVAEFAWGRAPEAAAIESRLREAEYRAVVVVHNESSTGVAADLAAIGAVVRRTPALLVVDSVSGLGGMEMRQDEWGVDVLLSASQKALMCPPGLGIASLSTKALEIVGRADRLARYYWDFRKAVASAETAETPFTPPVSLLYGLHEALEMIHEEGLETVLARHCRLANRLREGCAALGLTSLPEAPILSNTVVCLCVPEGLDGGQIVRDLYERHGTVIAGSRNRLKGRVIRIGTMGFVDDAEIRTDLEHLEATLTVLKETAHAR
jgi:aspartate aminotransferase-like enzyme